MNVDFFLACVCGEDASAIDGHSVQNDNDECSRNRLRRHIQCFMTH